MSTANGSWAGTPRQPRSPTWCSPRCGSHCGTGTDKAPPVEPDRLLLHSDAGSQYTSIRFTEHLELTGIAPSIRTVGHAYDNALMESIVGLFKAECTTTTVFHDGSYMTIVDVEYATTGWVNWCNHRRLHGTLGMLTPAEYEQAHYAAGNREPQPT